VGEPVSDVWEVVTRVTVVHVQFSPTILTYLCRPPFNILPYRLPYKVHPRQVQALLRMSTLMHVLSPPSQNPPYRSILLKVWVYSHWQHINECKGCQKR